MGRKEKALLITLAGNVILVGLVFALAAASGSSALQASAWHASSDLFVGLLVLAGFLTTRILEKSLSRKVTLVENLVSLVVAVLIFGVAYEVFFEALRGPVRELRNVLAVTLIDLSTIAICFFISRYQLYVGEQTGSNSLKALGYHSRMDIYTSVIVVAALLGYLIGLTGLDRAAALIIVVLIVGTGWEILTTAVGALTMRRTAADVHDHACITEVLQVLRESRQQGHLRAAAYYPLLGVVRLLGWLEQGIHSLMAVLQNNRRRMLRAVPAIIILLYLASGIYVVGSNQRGVVRRLGKKYALTGPGLHYRLPPPIDRLDLVSVEQIRRETLEGITLLTGDANIVEMEITLHYVVRDPSAYVLNTISPTEILRAAAKSAITEVIARDDIDSVLTADRARLQQEALEVAQPIIATGKTGIDLVNLQITRAWPPQATVEAFHDVWSAREDKVTYINEAQKEANRIVPEAVGEAAKRVTEAQSYRTDRVTRAEGEGGRFINRQAAYRLAPGVERKRLYLESMEKVLPGIKKYIVDSRLLPGSTTDLWFSRGDESIKPVE